MIYDVYCDESRQDLLVNRESISRQNKYCCIGGIMVPREERQLIKNKIYKLKNDYKVFGEIKWGNVSSNKLSFYLELINIFFEADKLSFRTVIIDAEKVDNQLFNDSDHELGYYKFYYQLLQHWLEYGDIYRVYTDYKTNKERTRLEDLKVFINRTGSMKRIELVQAINSKESVLLQLQNILMGAVGYKFNLGEEGKSVAKNEVVKRIEEKLGNPIRPTSKVDQKFNVFKINLQRGKN